MYEPYFDKNISSLPRETRLQKASFTFHGCKPLNRLANSNFRRNVIGQNLDWINAMVTVGLSLFEAGLYVGLFFVAALCLGKALFCSLSLFILDRTLCWSFFILCRTLCWSLPLEAHKHTYTHTHKTHISTLSGQGFVLFILCDGPSLFCVNLSWLCVNLSLFCVLSFFVYLYQSSCIFC